MFVSNVREIANRIDFCNGSFLDTKIRLNCLNGLLWIEKN